MNQNSEKDPWEQAARWLEYAAEAHREHDKHPAFDHDRCPDTGIAAPGYGAALLGQMARNFRNAEMRERVLAKLEGN